MSKEIDINKSNKSITFQNRGIGFTQIGIADEILNLIENLQQKNKQLKANWELIKQEMLKIRQSTFSKYNSNEWENCLSFNDDIEPILDKMKELEQGSDSNE